MDAGGHTFAAFAPAKGSDEKLPVLLFQSGYGSTPASHQVLMQAIADGGYVCVIPAREHDNCGQETIPKVFAGMAEGKSAGEQNAVSTDGTHLKAALDWVKGQKDGKVLGQAIDVTKIAAGGFSMGCLEVMVFSGQNMDVVGACIVISSSSGAAIETLYEFSQADLEAKVAAFTFPSLFIASDKDCQLGATKEVFAKAAAPSTILIFKDAHLDLSMAMTNKTSAWGPGTNDLFPGVRQHFALAAEAKDVSSEPILKFLDTTFKGKDAVAGISMAPEGALAEVYTK